ncbi:MAG: methyltransferase [Symploca sp. SIO2D2]|nr:methyltransferase [Symploca sp. SIO2D2]
MSDLRKLYETLPSEKRQLLEKLISQSKKNQELHQESRNIRSGKETILQSYYKSLGLDQRTEKEYARFAPFENIVNGFSWIELLLNPQKDLQNAELFLKAQNEMMSVLFRGIDFSSINKVVDIGCGYSSDLIALADKYPHIQYHGYNISPEQIETGNQKIKDFGHSQRINLYNRNSAEEPFLDNYDLVFSFQVIHHIKKKKNIFSNIGKYLCNGGLFVAAEILSNLPLTPVEDSKSTAYFSTISEWAELLSQHKLRVVEAVDTSLEIANFLYDPNFTENFTRLTSDYDEVAKDHLIGPHELGELLRKRLTSYILLTVQKDQHLNTDTILRLNQEKLSSPVPYAKIIAASKGEEPILFPKIDWEDSHSENGFDGLEQNSNSFLAQITSQEPEQRTSILESYFKTQVANILRLAQSDIKVEQSLNTMGLDSLMALELLHRVQNDLQVDIPISDLMVDSSISTVASQVSKLLSEGYSQAQVVSSENSEQPQTASGETIWREGEL